MAKILLFHGTEKKFEKFDPQYLGTTTETICGGSGNKLGFYFTDDFEIAKRYSQEAGADIGKEIVLVCEIKFDEDYTNDSYTSSDIENMEDEEVEELLESNCDVEIFKMENPYYTEYCVPVGYEENIKIIGCMEV